MLPWVWAWDRVFIYMECDPLQELLLCCLSHLPFPPSNLHKELQEQVEEAVVVTVRSIIRGAH